MQVNDPHHQVRSIIVTSVLSLHRVHTIQLSSRITFKELLAENSLSTPDDVFGGERGEPSEGSNVG